MNIKPWIFSAAGMAGLFGSPDGLAKDVPSLTPGWQDAPRLDGLWQSGEWAGGGRAQLVNAGCAQKPVVRVLETAAGLYVGLAMRDGTPVFGRSPGGQSLHQEDVFEIFFELQGDERRYAELQISRSGAAFHKIYLLREAPEVTATGRLSPEYLKNGFREEITPVPHGVRWAVGSAGGTWVAEVFLPRRLLGPLVRANFAVHDWNRALGVPDRTGRFYYWSEIEPGCPHISPSRFGRLILRS